MEAYKDNIEDDIVDSSEEEELKKDEIEEQSETNLQFT